MFLLGVGCEIKFVCRIDCTLDECCLSCQLLNFYAPYARCLSTPSSDI